jgi:hypothetical protein
VYKTYGFEEKMPMDKVAEAQKQARMFFGVPYRSNGKF